MSLIDRSKAEILERYRLSELMAGNLRLQLDAEREVSKALATWIERSGAHSQGCRMGKCVCGKQDALAQYTAQFNPRGWLTK